MESDFGGMSSRAISVSQLNNYIKQVFDAEELLHNVEVVGDVDGMKRAGNAVYFTLKDESASISCVCFYPDKLKDAENGHKVVVRGTVSYWHKAGKISFIVNSCAAFGFGQLFLKFQQLQEKLRAEGLFDVGAKKALPATVKRLGVVTSKTGAVIHDITVVTHRRNPAVDIVVCDVHVQGEGAENEIAAGIELMNKAGVDVIIVARGGGSKEDLNAFNSERVARAVFASAIPVVSAVGHENDFTLVDFVSDLRAATPSAAAELCVREVVSDREMALREWSILRGVMARKTDMLDAAAKELWYNLRSVTITKFSELESKLAVLATQIESNNPMAVLRRGFAKTSKQYNQLQIGDDFEIMFHDGKGVAKWIKDLNKSNN